MTTTLNDQVNQARKSRHETDNMDYNTMIGKKVKKQRSTSQREPKPFKSGLKINTVRGIIEHPILLIPAFVFEEDDSYVVCKRCVVADQ